MLFGRREASIMKYSLILYLKPEGSKYNGNLMCGAGESQFLEYLSLGQMVTNTLKYHRTDSTECTSITFILR